MTESLTIYVPSVEDPMSTHGIDPRSGIVGVDEDERVLIYFEGNRFGYCNVKTWADRVSVAAGRCIERYPTIAMRSVPREALIAVGSFVPYERVFVDNSEALADWLEVELDELGRETVLS